MRNVRHTLIAAASVSLLALGAAQAQTSGGDTSGMQGQSGGSDAMQSQTAAGMTCEDFLVLDTAKQGTVLMPLVVTSFSPSSDMSSGGSGTSGDTMSADSSSGSGAGQGTDMNATGSGTDTASATGGSGSGMSGTSGSDATSTDTASSGSTGTSDTMTSGSKTSSDMASSGSDTSTDSSGTAMASNGSSGSSGTSGMTNDKELVAVVTGLFEYCAGEPAAKMGDAVQSAGQSAQGASQASN